MRIILFLLLVLNLVLFHLVVNTFYDLTVINSFINSITGFMWTGFWSILFMVLALFAYRNKQFSYYFSSLVALLLLVIQAIFLCSLLLSGISSGDGPGIGMIFAFWPILSTIPIGIMSFVGYIVYVFKFRGREI